MRTINSTTRDADFRPIGKHIRSTVCQSVCLSAGPYNDYLDDGIFLRGELGLA